MYSITENIYYSQLSSVAILLQPEPVSHRIIQGKDCVLSPSVLSSYGLPRPPTCLLLTVNEARSYFAATITGIQDISLDCCKDPVRIFYILLVIWWYQSQRVSEETLEQYPVHWLSTYVRQYELQEPHQGRRVCVLSGDSSVSTCCQDIIRDVVCVYCLVSVASVRVARISSGTSCVFTVSCQNRQF
jgi:hypothetical protein